MNLVVEIGNTALKAAWVEGTTLGKTFRYQGEKKLEFILSITEKEKPEVMAVASVLEIGKSKEECLRRECAQLVIMDPSHSTILEKYGLPPYLTYDRAAALIGARYLFKGKEVTVMDFGTTMTVDFLDREGTYSGGNISPGCRTRFKSLNRYSRTLPLINTPELTEEKGHSFISSIESGVITGMIFEIQGYIDRNPESVVVFTGGDANYFVKKMKNSIFVVPNLVLLGLALITDEYVSKN